MNCVCYCLAFYRKNCSVLDDVARPFIKCDSCPSRAQPVDIHGSFRDWAQQSNALHKLCSNGLHWSSLVSSVLERADGGGSSESRHTTP
jgi:hypothetical protein